VTIERLATYLQVESIAVAALAPAVSIHSTNEPQLTKPLICRARR
jgi:hypothetical protein